MTALIELLDIVPVDGAASMLVKVNGRPTCELRLADDAHAVERAGPIVERLTGHMVQGRANASHALELAATALVVAATRLRATEAGALSLDRITAEEARAWASDAFDAAAAARVAAVNVRKEIPRP